MLLMILNLPYLLHVLAFIPYMQVSGLVRFFGKEYIFTSFCSSCICLNTRHTHIAISICSIQSIFYNVTIDVSNLESVKVILDNGAFATATWEVKKFQTPVQLRADYERTTVELGGSIAPSQIVFVDANGVEKVAKNGEVDFAATGYAIYSLNVADDCGAAREVKAITPSPFFCKSPTTVAS